MDSFSQGLEGLCTVSSSVLHGIEPRLKDFHQLLLSPPKVGDPEQLLGPYAGIVGRMTGKQMTRPANLRATRQTPEACFHSLICRMSVSSLR